METDCIVSFPQRTLGIVPDPASSLDIANKRYVDTHSGGGNPQILTYISNVPQRNRQGVRYEYLHPIASDTKGANGFAMQRDRSASFTTHFQLGKFRLYRAAWFVRTTFSGFPKPGYTLSWERNDHTQYTTIYENIKINTWTPVLPLNVSPWIPANHNANYRIESDVEYTAKDEVTVLQFLMDYTVDPILEETEEEWERRQEQQLLNDLREWDKL